MATEQQLIQNKIVYKAITEPEFAKTITALRSDLFEGNELLTDVFASISDYYREHSKPATKDVVTTYLSAKLDRKKILENDRLPYTVMVDDLFTVQEGSQKVFDDKIADYIKKVRATDAIKRVALAEFSPKAVDNLLLEIDKIRKEATATGLHPITDVFDPDSASYQADSIRNLKKGQIPIPIDAYNRATGGGLSKGEMGLIAASSGQGKTMNFSSMAVAYALAGYNVGYIALEELEARMFLRLYKGTLGTMQHSSSQDLPIGQMLDVDISAQVLGEGAYSKLLDKHERVTGTKRGSLKFTRYSPHTLSIDGLEQVIADMQMVDNEEDKLDIVFVDYPDLLKYGSGDNESSEGGRLYEEVRAIGQAYNVVMWVASQLNRTTYGADLKTGAQIEGSYRKRNAVEFSGVVNVSDEEFQAGYARILVDKGRNSGNAGEILYVRVDKNTGLVRDETPVELTEHATIMDGKQLQPSDNISQRRDTKGGAGDNMAGFLNNINTQLQVGGA